MFENSRRLEIITKLKYIGGWIFYLINQFNEIELSLKFIFIRYYDSLFG